MALIFLCGFVLRGLSAPFPQDTPPKTDPGEASRPSQQAPAPDSIRAVAEEVILDIVVRDRKGRGVRDLKQEEVEIFDDGVKQETLSFRWVERGRPAPETPQLADSGPAPVQVDPTRHISLVTLVFERLGPEARHLARQTALDFLGNDIPANTMVAVFTIDQRLYVLQQFTNDRNLLRQAVDRATSGGYTQFISLSEDIRRQLTSERVLFERGEGSGATVNRAAMSVGFRGAGSATAQLGRITLEILQYTEAMQEEMQGRSSLFSLLTLVREQGLLAGRKTLVYFSEGLHVPPGQVDLFRTVIGQANRANVSVYSVDSRGLLAAGLTSGTRSTLLDAADVSRSQVVAQGEAVTREQVMSSESAEASLRANLQGTLEDLSTSTGGFLVANTNDMRVRMRQVVEDIRGYYEVSYRPRNLVYDGRFHPVAARVSRPAVRLQTRSGYFALPPAAKGAPVLPYEMQLLGALQAATLAREFDYRAAALRFHSSREGVQHAFVMEVPLATLTFTPDKKKKSYRAHLAWLALVKNGEGEVVQKFSQDYPLEGPLAKADVARAQSAVFTRLVRLTPGRYTLETVVADREANKLSARKAVLLVAAPKPGVSLSSIAIVRRIDAVSANTPRTDDPLRHGDARIVPNLGEAIREERGSNLSLYMVVYPQSGAAEKPQLHVEFLREGAVVARAPLELPAPDAEGRITYMGSIPAATFQPGRYEIRAVARQGAAAAEEHAFFSISP